MTPPRLPLPPRTVKFFRSRPTDRSIALVPWPWKIAVDRQTVEIATNHNSSRARTNQQVARDRQAIEVARDHDMAAGSEVDIDPERSSYPRRH